MGHGKRSPEGGVMGSDSGYCDSPNCNFRPVFDTLLGKHDVLKAEVEKLKAQLQPQEESQEPDEFTKLRGELERLKADLSYANYHLDENVEMIQLAKGVVEDGKKLREALEYLARRLKEPVGPRGQEECRNVIDKALTGK